MSSFELQLLSADEPMYTGPCVSLQFPCSDGMYGIMAGHSPMLAAVVPGLLVYRTEEDGEHRLVVSTGMVKVDKNHVLVLVDSAERPEELDANRARRAAEDAERVLRGERSSREYLMARADLERALNRLHLQERIEKQQNGEKS